MKVVTDNEKNHLEHQGRDHGYNIDSEFIRKLGPPPSPLILALLGNWGKFLRSQVWYSTLLDFYID